jgi:MSHA biogenesis protein MshL
MQTERRAKLWLAPLLALSLSCATSSPPERLAGSQEVPPPTLAPRTVSIPDDDPRPAALRLLDETRFTLNVQEAELASLLLGLGRDSPFNVVVEPGVTGTVTADLEDLSLHEILDQLIYPLGYGYSVRGNVLRIFRGVRETRTYRVDYPNYQRRGSSDLTISGAIGASPEIASGGSGSSEAEDTSTAGVQTTQLVDFWAELEEGLRAIVFGTGEAGSGQSQAGAEGAGAGALIPARQVALARQAGLVTVTAEPSVLHQVEAYLDEVALSTQRQVLIDTRILEIDIGDELELGVDWEYAPGLGAGKVGTLTRSILPGFPAAAFAQELAPLLTSGGFLFGIAADQFGVELAALASQKDVRLVSTPSLATLNNHKAVIKVVRNEVFFIAEVKTEVVEAVGTTQTTEFVPQIIPVGVTLDITPQISEQGEITLHIHPSISEVVDIVPQPQGDPTLEESGSLPVIDLRETDTVMRVSDKTTIVIGGLIQSREFERQRKVPLLGDIPLLGQIFRRTDTEETRTELLIMVTPRILDPPRIVRVREEAERSIGEAEALRQERLHERPWWRPPFRQYYGVE